MHGAPFPEEVQATRSLSKHEQLRSPLEDQRSLSFVVKATRPFTCITIITFAHCATFCGKRGKRSLSVETNIMLPIFRIFFSNDNVSSLQTPGFRCRASFDQFQADMLFSLFINYVFALFNAFKYVRL